MAEAGTGKVRKLPAGVAFAALLAQARAEGSFRHGAIAQPAHGKTTWLRAAYLAALRAGFLGVVHDVTGPVRQYPGQVSEGPTEHLRAAWPRWFSPGRPASVVLRRPGASVGAAAAACAARPTSAPCVLCIDEIEAACIEGSRRWRRDADPVREIFTLGRRRGISVLWSCQLVTGVPMAAWKLSTSIALGANGKGAIDDMRRDLGLSDAVADLLPTLEPGDFVLYDPRRGDADGAIYNAAA